MLALGQVLEPTLEQKLALEQAPGLGLALGLAKRAKAREGRICEEKDSTDHVQDLAQQEILTLLTRLQTRRCGCASHLRFRLVLGTQVIVNILLGVV